MNVVRSRTALVAIVCVMIVAMALSGCLEDGENRPPRAIFETTVTTADVGDVITFDATNSTDKDGSITSYHWDFGDGSETMGVTAVHIYKRHGMFNVTLTVTDDMGKKSIFVQTIVVNAIPVAVIDADPDVQLIGDAVEFSSARSWDVDGSIVGYQWDLGDGNYSSEPGPTHTYASVGSYKVILTVTDNRGASASATDFVRVTLRTFKVNFTLSGRNLDNVRDFTAEGRATYHNVTIEVDNLHMVRFRLSWRDNIKPPGGAANDVFRLTVTPPAGTHMTANGTSENLTLLFPLASIPVNRTVEGKDIDSATQAVSESLGSQLGRGMWLVEIEALECGGFRDSENNWIDDPGNYWDLAVHYEYYEIVVTES